MVALAPLLLVAACTTISGPDAGAICQIPFKYKGRKYNGCTLVDAGDGRPWCSTKVDRYDINNNN